MKCVFCGGKTESKRVTFSYEEGDRYLMVENVPAEVCTKCGEKMYSPKVTDHLLKFADNKTQPAKVIKIPVFDFTE